MQVRTSCYLNVQAFLLTSPPASFYVDPLVHLFPPRPSSSFLEPFQSRIPPLPVCRSHILRRKQSPPPQVAVISDPT